MKLFTSFLFILLTGSLASAQPPKALDYIIVPADSGFKIGGGSWKLTSHLTGGAIAISEFKGKDTTGWNWVPSHVHTREDEIWYVIEGELSFKVDNEVRAAGPGSLVFGPRNRMHSYRISKAPVKYLLMLTPGGIDMLFTEVDSIGKRFPRGSTEFIKKVSLLGEKFGAYYPARWDSMNKAGNKINFHRMLARSAGQWMGKGTMQFSPDGPGVDAGTSILYNKMSADGLYQVSEIKGNTTPGTGDPWTGIRITGYDSTRKVFMRTMIGDGNAAGGVVMEGKWDEATQSITMPFKKRDPSTGKERNLKEVYKIIDENTEVLEIHAIDEKTGKEYKMLNVTWVRVK